LHFYLELGPPPHMHAFLLAAMLSSPALKLKNPLCLSWCSTPAVHTGVAVHHVIEFPYACLYYTYVNCHLFNCTLVFDEVLVMSSWASLALLRSQRGAPALQYCCLLMTRCILLLTAFGQTNIAYTWNYAGKNLPVKQNLYTYVCSKLDHWLARKS
jgi:hypothetical protein